MKTILITGGAGFIGSHLCDFYTAEGWRVLCLDNLITGSLDNIAGHKRDARFHFIRHDITRPIHIAGPVDLVLNFASPASPVDYMAHPLATLKVGSAGTHNCLGLAKTKKSRFLLASTSEVYGDPKVHPQTEKYWGHVNPIGPRSVYDEAKRFAEAITMAYHRVHRVDTRIIRIFNTYGPRMQIKDGRAIPNFLSGPPRRADHRLRDRKTDAFVLLCLRSRAWHRRLVAGDDLGPRECRQSRRDVAQGSGLEDQEDDGLEESYRVQTFAPGRSQAASAGYHPREKTPQVDPQGTARRWSCRDD
jgi:nucleoside-diphosphate-sugar epimerase